MDSEVFGFLGGVMFVLAAACIVCVLNSWMQARAVQDLSRTVVAMAQEMRLLKISESNSDAARIQSRNICIHDGNEVQRDENGKLRLVHVPQRMTPGMVQAGNDKLAEEKRKAVREHSAGRVSRPADSVFMNQEG